jgi:hypothetical protein
MQLALHRDGQYRKFRQRIPCYILDNFTKLPDFNTSTSLNLPQSHSSITWTFQRTWNHKIHIQRTNLMFGGMILQVLKINIQTWSNPLSWSFSGNWHNCTFVPSILEIACCWVRFEIFSAWQLRLQRLRININLQYQEYRFWLALRG